MLAILAGGVGLLRSCPQISLRGKILPSANLTSVVIKCEFPANVNTELLKAIDFALSGKWDAAHAIVQQYEDPTAAWIHAILHKIEGDEDNSQYWYRRAGKLEHFSDEPKGELEGIRGEIAGG